MMRESFTNNVGRLSRSAFCIVALFASACGGDSSDNDVDSNPNRLDGLWSGAMTKVTDTCNRGATPTITFTDQVVQNGSAIVLTSADALRYLGNAVGDNGFSVDANTTVQRGNATCNQLRRIEYDAINNNEDNTAETEIRITETCGTATCEVSYSGTGSRGAGSGGSGNGGAVATALPQGTTTPSAVAGGCAAMNPNTAAGTYAGNGGCGISDVAFSFGSSGGAATTVLNPFGSNGLTSFVIDPAKPSTATSVSSDLTINGEAGNSCLMVCSPPGTFTVTCNKEGGTQCVEKF